MTTGIYKVTNNINNKVYIGQSLNIEKRISSHLYDAKNSGRPQTGLEVAIRKYGEEHFIFKIIEVCDVEKLDEREIFWINFYNSYEEGYNRTLGGKALRGEDHPRAILTNKDVWDIREEYKKRTPRKDVITKYLDRGISERELIHIWQGDNWQTVHYDVYTEENREKHRHTAYYGHSKDQIGKSPLDRAIKQEEIDLWVKEYQGGLTINAIAKKYNRDNGTVEKYVNDPNQVKEVKYHGRTVQNIETGIIFNSILSAAKWAKCGATTLTRHLATDQIAGLVPETGEKAHWKEIL